MYELLFYTATDGDSPVDEFLDSISIKPRAKIMAWMKLLEEKGPELKRPYADIIRGKIRELRVKFAGNQYRILYFFFSRSQIVLLIGFQKKTKEIPEDEIKRANRRMVDFINRYKKGEILL